MTYTRFRRSTTNPTFPGGVIRAKLHANENGMSEIVELWQHETGLDFEIAFPENTPIPGSACQSCAAIRYTCGNERPCERCVRLGLECMPQTAQKGASKRKAAHGGRFDESIA